MFERMEHERVDLRGLPVWERPSRIFEAFDRLPEGRALTFVTENEPRGLSARILQARKHELILTPRCMGEGEWHVTVTRTDVDPARTPEVFLARCVPFAQLSIDECARIAAVSTALTARRGQTIVTANEDWPYVGIVCEGVLSLSSGQTAQRERSYYDIFPHEVFGETEFFDRAHAFGRVSVLSKTATYLRIPRDVVLAVGLSQPRVLLALGEIGAQRMRGLAKTLATQATTPILARIAQVLLPYAMPDEGLAQASPTLLGVTQSQIAASAGTVKEVAARAIAELEGRQLLRRERGHIGFLDRQGLVNLVRELT